MEPLVELKAATKVYSRGATTLTALAGLSLAIPEGEFVAVVGPSGSGKSTLLHLCGALDRPTSGEVRIAGRSLGELDDDGLTRLRRDTIAFVFQFFNLLPTLSARENVELPALLAGRVEREVRADAARLLDEVGVGARRDHKPDELSGGELQRTAVARALIMRPRLLLADEPTGNLDSKTGDEILRLLRDVCASRGASVVMVTHDPKMAARADRVVSLKDGRLVGDVHNVKENAS